MPPTEKKTALNWPVLEIVKEFLICSHKIKDQQKPKV